MKMSSSSSPCAACKFLRRKCTQECVFAPYFPADQPQKFAHVHKIFGASNVTKLLNDLNAAQREDAVNSLAYEAEARLRDPVYGCVGFISLLQQKLKRMQEDLIEAKKELATYMGPGAMLPFLQGPEFMQHQILCNNPSSSSVVPYNNMPPMMGIATGPVQGSALVIREPQQQQQHHQQQLFEAQQLAAAVAAREQQEMMRNYEQKPKQEFVRFNGAFDSGSTVTTPCGGFSHMTGGGGGAAAAALSPSLALGTFDNHFRSLEPEDDTHHNQFEAQLFLQSEEPPESQQQQQQEQHQLHQRSISERG